MCKTQEACGVASESSSGDHSEQDVRWLQESGQVRRLCAPATSTAWSRHRAQQGLGCSSSSQCVEDEAELGGHLVPEKGRGSQASKWEGMARPSCTSPPVPPPLACAGRSDYKSREDKTGMRHSQTHVHG